jgi:adenylate cyclase
MQIAYSHKGKFEERKIFDDDVIIGRPEGGGKVDLDLGFDPWVSHRHARIWLENGNYWVEDLGSKNGTTLNGEKMQPREARLLRAGDSVRLGDTTVRLVPFSEGAKNDEGARITRTLDARNLIYSAQDCGNSDLEHRLAVLYELPLQFGEEMQFDALLRMIVTKLVDVVQGSRRAALILKDAATDTLLLKAHVPPGKPYVSMTLARRAIEQKVGFIWQREQDPGVTQAADVANCAIYAPLLWKGKALGVVLVDNYQGSRVLDNDDLKLVTAIAQQAAMAVANQLLQEELCRESAIRANLLRQFSPKIAERLLHHRGRLRLGGERCEVTVLFADIRGFSKLSQGMEPESIVELLNDYFSSLIPVIFSFDGSVEKYVGDGIVAVFGSPESDPHHHEKAVRAALEMQKNIAVLNAARQVKSEVTCNIGIGLHCGEVVHGFVGMAEQMGFGWIGDAMNRTSRYCAGAKAGEVLISPELYEHVWRIIQDAEPVTIDAKFDQRLSGYRVKEVR